MWESTAICSPSRPSAVTAFARKVMLVSVGFADTDIRIGVEEPLLIATALIVGFEVPNIASPCAASLSVQFETPMLSFVISTMPLATEFVPNLSVQYWSEPVEPWLNTMRPQSPRFGAVIEPLLFVSEGRPKLSSWIDVMTMLPPGAEVPFIVRLPDTEIVYPAVGLMTTPGLIVRLAPEL